MRLLYFVLCDVIGVAGTEVCGDVDVGVVRSFVDRTAAMEASKDIAGMAVKHVAMAHSVVRSRVMSSLIDKAQHTIAHPPASLPPPLPSKEEEEAGGRQQGPSEVRLTTHPSIHSLTLYM